MVFGVFCLRNGDYSVSWVFFNYLQFVIEIHKVVWYNRK